MLEIAQYNRATFLSVALSLQVFIHELNQGAAYGYNVLTVKQV